MRPIYLARFNALAGYCRQPPARLLAEELAWFEHGDERILGFVIRDRADDDFGGMVLGRDQKGRFRWIGSTRFHKSQRRAEMALRREMEVSFLAPDEKYYQGGETGIPLDFFTPRTARERLSREFVYLAEQEHFSPARGIIDPMMHWYEDLDGNFVEQFQTTGFNARLWELYLFPTFMEMGYGIERIHAVPDFTCVGIADKFTDEAMTVNPTRDERTGMPVPSPSHNTHKEHVDFLRNYMPIKFGSVLRSKLSKKYWEKSSASNAPLLFAIADFSSPASMLYTRSALIMYLYGYDYGWFYENTGQLEIVPRKITVHRWKDKTIPSGFFDLPESENVSAVLFNNSGTISKFNRMGVVAGFGSGRVMLVREGLACDHSPNSATPRSFKHVVNSPDYSETWSEGLDVFHNPRAKYPIEQDMLPGVAHHRILDDGQMQSVIPRWHPLRSVTQIYILTSA